MSTKQPRHTPSPAPSLSTNHSTSKFPKFLQKQPNRDGPRSVTEPAAGNLTTRATSSSAAPPSPEFSQSSIPIAKTRKASKFLGIKDKEKERKPSSATPFSPPPATDVGEAPVIVEPLSIPRPRTRSERPLASTPDSLHSSSQLYSSTSSTSRIGDLPTRLSGWFSHTFSTSSTDIPSLLAYHSTASPKSKAPSALLTAAKHSKGHLDKAMRYLLDSDATPDKCTDPIWLLGVQHPGYEPPLSALPDVVAISPVNNSNNANSGVGSSFGLPFRRNSGSPSSFRSSTSSIASSELSQSTNSSSSKVPNPAANWPPVFYIDFTSRIWLTYRSQFPVPIKDERLADLSDTAASGYGGNNELGEDVSPTISKSKPWNWVGVGGGEKTWTSDSGWGCMLRTGQSLLANALIHMHLGRGLFLSFQKNIDSL
jgi:cysteine protease ATG4